EGLAGGLDGEVDVGLVALGHLANGVARGRVDGGERLAGDAIEPFAADQQRLVLDPGRLDGAGLGDGGHANPPIETGEARNRIHTVPEAGLLPARAGLSRTRQSSPLAPPSGGRTGPRQSSPPAPAGGGGGGGGGGVSFPLTPEAGARGARQPHEGYSNLSSNRFGQLPFLGVSMNAFTVRQDPCALDFLALGA